MDNKQRFKDIIETITGIIIVAVPIIIISILVKNWKITAIIIIAVVIGLTIWGSIDDWKERTKKKKRVRVNFEEVLINVISYTLAFIIIAAILVVPVVIVSVIFKNWKITVLLIIAEVVALTIYGCIGDKDERSKKKTVERKSISRLTIDTMEGLEFEGFCANILRANGYVDVKVTKGSGDQGVDILATDGDERYAIQVKRYSEPVGNAAVQAVFAGAKYYGSSKPVVLTNNRFTHQAVELARRIGVDLWGRQKLFSMIKSAGYIITD